MNQLIKLEDELQVISEHSNGKDAITAALELDPDIIILDLNMQGMDGLETVKELRTKVLALVLLC